MTVEEGGELILTKFNIIAFKMKNSGSTEDGHVLELSLSNGWAVVGDEHEFRLSIPE